MGHTIIVNESCKTLRALGRNSLKGKWGLGVLGSFIYMAIMLIPMGLFWLIIGDDIAGGMIWLIYLYLFLVCGPLELGYVMFAISIFRKKETSAAEVLYGFERYGKAFGLYFVTSIFIILWSFLLYIPGIIAYYRYSQAFFILADNPNIGIMEAIAESKRMMKGNKMKKFLLDLSFIGWAILAELTVIGLLWLLPYQQVASVAFYDILNGSLRASGTESTVIPENSSMSNNTEIYMPNAENPVENTDTAVISEESKAEETVLVDGESEVKESITSDVDTQDETKIEE